MLPEFLASVTEVASVPCPTNSARLYMPHGSHALAAEIAREFHAGIGESKKALKSNSSKSSDTFRYQPVATESSFLLPPFFYLSLISLFFN
jgi:hypothetical protein